MTRYELCEKFRRPGFSEKVSCQQRTSRTVSDQADRSMLLESGFLPMVVVVYCICQTRTSCYWEIPTHDLDFYNGCVSTVWSVTAMS